MLTTSPTQDDGIRMTQPRTNTFGAGMLLRNRPPPPRQDDDDNDDESETASIVGTNVDDHLAQAGTGYVPPAAPPISQVLLEDAIAPADEESPYATFRARP